MNTNAEVTLQTIEEAARTLAGHAIRTPVETCETLDLLAGRKLFFKCENFQKSGAFKFRGAFNAVSRLVRSNEPTQRELHVVGDSSGNYACGLALAARLCGVSAHVVMPNNAPECKKQIVLSYGATLIQRERRQDFPQTIKQVQEMTGAVYISGSQNPDVISGQGTMGLELLQQVPDLDAVIMPVGGGGMLAGVSMAIKSICPDVRVYGAEPEVANQATLSLQNGERFVYSYVPRSIADGVVAGIGPVTWTYIRDNVDDIFTVTEDEIKNAMRLVSERMKLVVEPSGVVGVAAALSDSFRARAVGFKNVAVILSGGNVDLQKLPELLLM
ncbi:serine racemase-like [Branchiostoma lanceolatum]|uniref:serine racemase-like n=1 Tax=Branchiostoma lanceolatum TaxID=7740 RepID=UPI003452EE54